MQKVKSKRYTSPTPLLPIVLLCLLFTLLVGGAKQLSFTFDEPSHIAAGYAYLARGATWTVPQRGHPLLVDAWEALPVYVAAPHIPLETLEGWQTDHAYIQYVRAFTPFLERDRVRARFAARVPAILLTIILAAVVYRWGHDSGGPSVGLVALIILTFDPTLLAHGRLATNDGGVTALGTLGLYLVWRWSHHITWKRTGLVGLVLGMTLLAKGSGILWVGVGGTWALAHLIRVRVRDASAWLKLGLMGLLALALLWGTYGFQVGALPSLRWVPASQHWRAVLFHADNAATDELLALGILQAIPWWACAPLIFCVKNPLPLLILLPISLGILLNQRPFWRSIQVLLAFVIVYTPAVVARGPSLAYRHALPLHPLLYLLVAGGVVALWQRGVHIAQVGLLILGTWYIGNTLRVYPHNLAFFNALAGGPENGWRYAYSSNTDWGQAWDTLRAFAAQYPRPFSYAGPEGYAGMAPEDVWDESLPPLNQAPDVLFRPWLFPEPGDYVISASSLQGLWLVDPDNYAWFRYHPPQDVIGEVLFHYRITSAIAPVWLAQCTEPAPPLNPQAIAEGFAVSDLRQVAFDCQQSWIYPEAGRTRGVYALHAANLRPPTYRERLYLAPARPVDTFAARHLAPLPMAFRSWESRDLPALALYEWSEHEPPNLPLRTAIPAPADTVPMRGKRNQTPLPLEGPLIFLGTRVSKESERLDIETWWQVTEGPVSRPLSIMAHLLTEDNAVLGIADGLGVPPLIWLPGDIVVQRHVFPVSGEPGPLWLRTGVYWLDTGARWSVSNAPPGTDALLIPLK